MRPKVLIVEDDAIIREIYMLKFELEGHEVVGAENGKRALEVLDGFEPDVILLDMMMPVMGGLEFMENMHERDHGAEVIVFSNISAPDQMEAVMKLGASDYWIKSDFTPELAVDALTKRWQERR